MLYVKPPEKFCFSLIYRLRPNQRRKIKSCLTGATLSSRKLFQTRSDGIQLFSTTGNAETLGATSPHWISVSVSLAFDKWDGRRRRRKGNVLKQKWEGGWKRGILWLDVMHASVSVCTVQHRSVVFIFLRASIEGCTHLDKCRSSALVVNHSVFCRVHVCTCLTETKRDALRLLRLRTWEYFIVRSKAKERETNPPMV